MGIWDAIQQAVLSGPPPINDLSRSLPPPSSIGGAWSRVLRQGWLRWFQAAIQSPKTTPTPEGTTLEFGPQPPPYTAFGLQSVTPEALGKAIFTSDVIAKAQARTKLLRELLDYAHAVNCWFSRALLAVTGDMTRTHIILGVAQLPIWFQGGYRNFFLAMSQTMESYYSKSGSRFLDAGPYRNAARQRLKNQLLGIIKAVHETHPLLLSRKEFEELASLIEDLPAPGERSMPKVEDIELSDEYSFDWFVKTYAPFYSPTKPHAEFSEFCQELSKGLDEQGKAFVEKQVLPMMQSIYNSIVEQQYIEYLVAWAPGVAYLKVPGIPFRPFSWIAKRGGIELDKLVNMSEVLPQNLKDWARSLVEDQAWKRDVVHLTPDSINALMTGVCLRLIDKRPEIEAFIRKFTQASHLEDSKLSELVALYTLQTIQSKLIAWMAAGRSWKTWQDLEADLDSLFESKLRLAELQAREEARQGLFPTDIYDMMWYAWKPVFKPTSSFVFRPGKSMLKSSVYKDYRENVETDIFEANVRPWLDGFAWTVSRTYISDPHAARDLVDEMRKQVTAACDAARQRIRELVPDGVDLRPIEERIDSFKEFWSAKSHPLRGAGGPRDFVTSTQRLFAELAQLLVECMSDRHWTWGIQTKKGIPVLSPGWSRARAEIGAIVSQAAQAFVDALNDPPVSGELAPEARLLGTPAQQLLGHAVSVLVVDPIQDAAIWDSSFLAEFGMRRPEIVGEIVTRLIKNKDLLEQVQAIANSDPDLSLSAKIPRILSWAKAHEDILWQTGMQVVSELSPDWGIVMIPRIEEQPSYPLDVVPPALRARFFELVDKSIEDAGGKEDLAERLASVFIDLYPDLWPDVPIKRKKEKLKDLIKIHLDPAIKQSAWSLLGRMFMDQAVNFKSEEEIKMSIDQAPRPELWLDFDSKRLAGMIFWDLTVLMAPVVHYEAGYNPWSKQVDKLIQSHKIELGRVSSSTSQIGLQRLETEADSLPWLAGTATGWNRLDLEAAFPLVKALAWQELLRQIPPGLPLAPRILLLNDLDKWLDSTIEHDITPFMIGEISWNNSKEHMDEVVGQAVNEIVKLFEADWVKSDRLGSYNRLPSERDVRRASEITQYVPRPYRTHLYVWGWLKDAWEKEFEDRSLKDPEWMENLIRRSLNDPEVFRAAKAVVSAKMSDSGSHAPPSDGYVKQSLVSQLIQEFREGGRFRGNIEATIEQRLMDIIEYSGWTKEGPAGVSVEFFDRHAQQIVNEAVLVWLRKGEVKVLPRLGPSADLDIVSIKGAIDRWIEASKDWIGEGPTPDLKSVARKLSDLSEHFAPSPDLGAWGRSSIVRSSVADLVRMSLRDLKPEDPLVVKVANAMMEARDQLTQYKDKLDELPESVIDQITSFVTTDPSQYALSVASSVYRNPGASIQSNLEYARLPGGWWKRPAELIVTSVGPSAPVQDSVPPPSAPEDKLEPWKVAIWRAADPMAESLGDALLNYISKRWDEENHDYPIGMEQVLKSHSSTQTNLATYLEGLVTSIISSFGSVLSFPTDQTAKAALELLYSSCRPMLDAMVEDRMASMIRDEFDLEELESYVKKMPKEVRELIWSEDAKKLIERVESGSQVEIPEVSWTPRMLAKDKVTTLISSLVGPVFARVPASLRDNLVNDLNKLLRDEETSVLEPTAAVFLPLDPSGRRAGIVLDNVIKRRFGLDKPDWTIGVVVRALTATGSQEEAVVTPEIQALERLAGMEDEQLIRELINLGQGAKVVDAAAEVAARSKAFRDVTELNKWAAGLLLKLYNGKTEDVVKEISKYLIPDQYWLSKVRLSLADMASDWRSFLSRVYFSSDEVPKGLVPEIGVLLSSALGEMKTPQPEQPPGLEPDKAAELQDLLFQKLRSTDVFGDTQHSSWVRQQRQWLRSTDPSQIVDQIVRSPEFQHRPYGKRNFVGFVLSNIPDPPEDIKELYDEGKIDDAFNLIVERGLHLDPSLAQSWHDFVFKTMGSEKGKSISALVGDYYRLMTLRFANSLATEGTSPDELNPEELAPRFYTGLNAGLHQLLAANLDYFVTPGWRRRVSPNDILIQFQRAGEIGFDIAAPVVRTALRDQWVRSLFRYGRPIYATYSMIPAHNSMIRERIQQVLSGYAKHLWDEYIESHVDEEGHLYVTLDRLYEIEQDLAREVAHRGAQILNEFVDVPDWSQVLETFVSSTDPTEIIRTWFYSQNIWKADDPDSMMARMSIVTNQGRVRDAMLDLGLICDPSYTVLYLNDFAEQVWRAQEWVSGATSYQPGLTREDIIRYYIRSGAAAYDLLAAQGDPEREAKVKKARALLSQLLTPPSSGSLSPGQPHLLQVLDLLTYAYHLGAAIPVTRGDTVGLSQAYMKLYQEALRRNDEYWTRYLYTWPEAERKASHLAGIHWIFSRGRPATNRAIYTFLRDKLVDGQGNRWTQKEAEELWNKYCEPALRSQNAQAMCYYYWMYVKPFSQQLSRLGAVDSFWDERERRYLDVLHKLARKGLVEFRKGQPLNPVENPLLIAPVGVVKPEEESEAPEASEKPDQSVVEGIAEDLSFVKPIEPPTWPEVNGGTESNP